MLLFFWVIFDMGTLSNHRRTRRCLVKNAVPTTENRPLQIIYIAYPDRTIYNKRRIQFSLVHLGSMVVMFFCCVICKQNSFLLRCFLKKMRFRSIIFFFYLLPVLFASCLDVFVHIYFPPWRARPVALLTTRISLSHT